MPKKGASKKGNPPMRSSTRIKEKAKVEKKVDDKKTKLPLKIKGKESTSEVRCSRKRKRDTDSSSEQSPSPRRETKRGTKTRGKEKASTRASSSSSDRSRSPKDRKSRDRYRRKEKASSRYSSSSSSSSSERSPRRSYRKRRSSKSKKKSKDSKKGEFRLWSDVSDDELPDSPQDLDAEEMASHLDEKTIQKIIQGRYISLSTLLTSKRSVEKVVVDKTDNSLSSITNNRRLFNYSEWQDAFLIYAAIRSQAVPEEAPSLFKYLQSIKRMEARKANFVAYDEAFRRKHRGKERIPWGTLDTVHFAWSQGDPEYTPYEKYENRHK